MRPAAREQEVIGMASGLCHVGTSHLRSNRQSPTQRRPIAFVPARPASAAALLSNDRLPDCPCTAHFRTPFTQSMPSPPVLHSAGDGPHRMRRGCPRGY